MEENAHFAFKIRMNAQIYLTWKAEYKKPTIFSVSLSIIAIEIKYLLALSQERTETFAGLDSINERLESG